MDIQVESALPEDAGQIRLLGMAALFLDFTFAVFITILTIYGISDMTKLDVAGALAVGIPHPVAYLAMLGALIGARRARLIPDGRLARSTYWALRWLLVCLLAGMALAIVAVVLPATGTVIAIVVTLVFILAHLVATPFGIALWQAARVSRLSASLFVAVVPAIIALFILAGLGIEVLPAWFEAVLALAFASLGYDLVRASGMGSTA